MMLIFPLNYINFTVDALLGFNQSAYGNNLVTPASGHYRGLLLLVTANMDTTTGLGTCILFPGTYMYMSATIYM